MRCTSGDVNFPDVQGCQVGQASQRLATVAKENLDTLASEKIVTALSGSQTPQGSQGRHKGAVDLDAADVQGLQVQWRSCSSPARKAQQKAVAIQSKALVQWKFEACSLPGTKPSIRSNCAFLVSTGTTEERGERSKKGSRQLNLGPRMYQLFQLDQL